MSINRSRYTTIYPMMSVPDFPKGKRIWAMAGDLVRRWYDEGTIELKSPVGITHREILAVGILLGHSIAVLDEDAELVRLLSELTCE